MIEQMLVLSTAHLTEHTCNTVLPDLAKTSPVWAKGCYGWFVYVTEEPLGPENADYPTDLEACFHFAETQHVQWIMFDRDAPKIVNLPVFKW